jgi:hypothetical protein
MSEDREYKSRIGAGLVGAGAGVATGALANKALMNSLSSEAGDGKSKFKKVLKNIGKKEFSAKGEKVNAYGFKTKSGKRILVYNHKKGKRFSDFVIPNVGHQDVLKKMGLKHKDTLRYAKKHRKNLHFIKSNNDATALLHELGHSKGYNRSGIRLSSYSPSILTSAFIPATALLTSKRSSESEQDYRSRVGKNIGIATGVTAGLSAPRLLEEARASRNAINIGKKIKVKPNRGSLYKAFGTYASKGLLVPAAAGLGAYGTFNAIRDKSGHYKTASHSKVDQARKNAEARYKQHEIKHLIRSLAAGGVGAGIARSLPKSAHSSAKYRHMGLLGAIIASGLYTQYTKLSKEDKELILRDEMRKLGKL